MNPELTEDQEFFRETARRFLTAETPLTVIRELYDDLDGFDREWWRKAAELGWAAMFVPESLGGGTLSGNPTADTVIIAEEIGRQVAPGPFLPVNVVAASLAWSGTDEQQAPLANLVRGDAIASWAYAEAGGRWSPSAFTTAAEIIGDTVVLRGAKSYVEAAAVSDSFLVTALSERGLTQVMVPARHDGVTIRRGRSVDMTRRFGTVTFDDVRLPVSAVVGEPGEAAGAVERQCALAVVLQCAGMVGAADRTLEFTLEFGRDRYAFGRPIVSFQALKHRIADMLTRLEGAKAVTDALAAAIDADDSGTTELARVAKAYVGEHATDIIDDCVQITGGVGITWEHDIHLYSRRAILDRALFGTPEQHKLAIAKGLTRGAA